MSEPYELNRRIRKVQAELDDIDLLADDRLSGLRQAVADRLDSLLVQHRKARTILQESEAHRG